MGSEASLWNTLRKNMKDRWKATRVENPAAPGTPDVYYTLTDTIWGHPMGWLELKHAHSWPKRESTILSVDHFTPQQRMFIRIHGKIGANVKLLIQVERDYLLFNWENSLLVGNLTKKEMFKECMMYWHPRINFDHLSMYLEE